MRYPTTVLPVHMHCPTKWHPCHEDDFQHTTYMDVGKWREQGAEALQAISKKCRELQSHSFDVMTGLKKIKSFSL